MSENQLHFPLHTNEMQIIIPKSLEVGMYKLAIFDMDGTILNTIDDLTDASNFINAQYGFPGHTVEQFKFFVGNGIPKMIHRSLPADVSPDLYEKILAEYIKYYENHCAIKTAPYEGVVDCIKKLRAAGIKIAVNTNKVESAAVDLCNTYFPGCFDIISGSRPGVPPKPAPDGIFEILTRGGISLENARHGGADGTATACYIGDSDVDLQTGLNSGLDFIGVDWGFRGRDFLQKHGAKNIVMNADELFEKLTSSK